MILFFYNLALLVVLVVGAPWWLFRMATTQKYREGFGQRLGRVPQLEGRRERPLIWMHAVSVGEVLAVSRLVKRLDAVLPGYFIAVSTTTRTGQTLAREHFGANRVFYCPLDLPWAVSAYLKALEPRMLVLAETEFWPNLLSGCFRREIPVAVVNARISDRSWPRYRRLRALWRPFLERISCVLAQSETDHLRLVEIGCDAGRVSVSGNLKFDIRAALETDATRILKDLKLGNRLVVAGSTLEGEEAALLEAWPKLLEIDPQLVMVLAPRHPERFDGVAALLEQSGFDWKRRTEWRSQQAGSIEMLKPGQIVLLDTIGELASVYSLASVAFVGGSLVPAGGHNPLEPAQFGVPVVMGPNYVNFREITEYLRARDAIRIAEPNDFANVLIGLLGDQAGAEAMGERARQVFEQQSGATERSVEALRKLIGDGGATTGIAEPATPTRAALDDTKRDLSARRFLLPLVPLYRIGQVMRDWRRGSKPAGLLRHPVVSIGNLSTGGTGKTPLTIALATALVERGFHVDVLSRGFGRTGLHPIRVAAEGTAEEFGDEPLLIARATGVPVYVARERYEAGMLAEGDAAAIAFLGEKPMPVIHLLDDGFQHRQLARAVDIVLLDREDWTGSLLPAGNLREPLSALRRATIVAIPVGDPGLETELRAWGWQGPVWQVRRQMSVPAVDGPVAAFCGIARPAQFFAGLEAAGMRLASRTAFPDHHPYMVKDLDRLLATARAVGAVAQVTTEKDEVRLGDLLAGLPGALPLVTAALRMEILDFDGAIRWLMERLKRAAG